MGGAGFLLVENVHGRVAVRAVILLLGLLHRREPEHRPEAAVEQPGELDAAQLEARLELDLGRARGRGVVRQPTGLAAHGDEGARRVVWRRLVGGAMQFDAARC